MGEHYRVKFIIKGEMHYGVVESFSAEASALAKQGKLLIEDAVFPQAYEIDEKHVTDVPFTVDGEYDQYVERMYLSAKSKSDELQSGKAVVGKLVQFPVADGYASYIITKVNKRSVNLEWRGFALDRYMEPVLGWEGKMDKERLEKMLAIEARLSNMFKSEKSEDLRGDL